MFFSKLFGKKKDREDAERKEAPGETEEMQTSGTSSRLENLLAGKGLSRFYEQMKPYLRNSVRLTPEKCGDEQIAVGASKFGGCPDLPPDTAWFTNPDSGAQLSFVCQINCAQAKPYDADDRLPARGMLYLFYDCSENGMPWGFAPKDAAGSKVFYTEARLSSLVRRDVPAGATEFSAARISFAAEENLPDMTSCHAAKLDLSDDEIEALSRYTDEKADEGARNKLLGHSDNIQNDMETECAFVAAGIYCGGTEGYEQGRAAGLDKTAGDWSLLMQVDSNEELRMMWGDKGKLYVWIREGDLKEKRFDHARLILQCY